MGKLRVTPLLIASKSVPHLRLKPKNRLQKRPFLWPTDILLPKNKNNENTNQINHIDDWSPFVGGSFLQAQNTNQKVVLITGTASGIGKATAELLIEEGHIVYGGDIQFEKNRYLDKIGGHSLDMDVTDTTMIKAGVEKIIQEQGRIDVLVNNAGFGVYAPVEITTEKDMRYQFEVNVFGVANVTRAVLPYMRPQRSGKIINISSMGGKIYMPLGAWYHATKHAIEGWSDCLRLELKAFNIDVVIIEPGAINTNFGNVMLGYMEKYKDDTAYSHMIQPYLQMTENMDSSIGAGPIVIAKEINKAINAKIPKIRYLKGPMARIMVGYRNMFGDRVFDDFITQAFNPTLRQSLTVGTNGLAYLNEGYDINVSYNRGLMRLGLNYTDIDFSTDNDFRDNRRALGLFLGTFLKYSHTGINFGLGFDYVTENKVDLLGDDEIVTETLEKDLYRVYFRTAILIEVLKFNKVSIFVEPGLNTAYGFGDEDLSFQGGKVYEKVGFEFTPFVNIGTKITF